MWLIFAVHAILCELGDLSLLSQPVPYNDGSEATVYEHLLASVNFLYGFRGLHGLIMIRGGDWNDCMNLAGLSVRCQRVAQYCFLPCRQLSEISCWHGGLHTGLYCV